MGEGKTQLLWGAWIAAFFALIIWGPRADTPLLFGMTLGSLDILVGIAVVLAVIVRTILSPPQGRGATNLLALNLTFLCLSLTTVVQNEKDRLLHVSGFAAIACAAALALFLFVRNAFQGARLGDAR